MEKLHTCLFLTFLWVAGIAQAQPSKDLLASNQSPQQPVMQKAQNHLAKFSVYDFTTKSPIDHAIVTDQSGNELGMTNTRGNLEVVLPLNTREYYTIQAEGFGPLRVRLDQSGKKSAKYEIYLPSLELGYSHKSMNEADKFEEKEKVKIYVKQDPSTYQKKNQQGGEITFSVQVAASSHPIAEKAAMDQWQDLGRVYIQQEDNMYKLRIGPFGTQTEAKEVLLAAKSKGRKDAFIVVQQGTQANAVTELKRPAPVETPAPVVEVQPAPMETSNIEGEYKVRVASYLQPGAFNPEGIDNLGTLESYRKGEWTIMMIGGFKNLEEARRAQQIVAAKGFSDAAVVIDNGGIIETVEEK